MRKILDFFSVVLIFQVFREARRTAPSIVYIPNARRWWQLAPPTVRHTFQFSMETLPVGLRVLILGIWLVL